MKILIGWLYKNPADVGFIRCQLILISTVSKRGCIYMVEYSMPNQIYLAALSNIFIVFEDI